MVGVAARSRRLSWSIWSSRWSISSIEALTFERQGSGTSSFARSRRPSAPNRSVTGQGRPKLISVEWIRFLSADLCLTRWSRKRASSRSSRTPGSGKPDRRHQVAMARGSQGPASRSCRSLRPGSEALDPLGIGDLDVPAVLLERVVNEPGAGHRLDHGADRLCMNLVDPPRERSQSSRRPVGRRAGRGARPARRAGRRRSFADSGLIQRATCEPGLLGASRLVMTTEGLTNGGPFSWQSICGSARHSLSAAQPPRFLSDSEAGAPENRSACIRAQALRPLSPPRSRSFVAASWARTARR